MYTPTARELAGGYDRLKTDIDLAVADANWAYAASGVIQRINVVLATEVDYVPHDDGNVNLRRLQNPNDGHLDEVHAIRDRYAADIVTLIPGGRHIQGLSFGILRELSTDFAKYAFTAQGISGYGFAHEFGHIQGLYHDRAPCLTGEVTVRLQASDGQFVSASRNGGYDVSATRDSTGPWEHFRLVDANGGCVAAGDTVYFHTSDGFYLRAEFGGGPDSVVDARGTSAGQDEQFVIRRSTGTDTYIRAGDSVTLEAAGGHYVVAEDGGGGALLASSRSAGSWETFRVSTADWFRRLQR